ncbi:MAG TPA: host-nuclease inhibitor Gam family protein [Bosea sp. (in: a-proteobacteria)]|jgi:phage host-nuclease inhibitor protein Gam|uniref:host-nuclease inhibitor Gam family protein n=1 Tax=Bosea sp. (in: a-proteobacteria) TaxID=1871050 RepID=UPI002DDCCA82|nr:host-nuclease inhibitor Gam family protein [Bosea sp. (in: a-proteobacteria)]HEV2556840.1 host-nuclease inhibitor Gam family protein [Bosea sp. (in: a-proteobacteria)]
MSRLKSKTLGANLPVPQNRDDAARAVREIGDDRRRLARLEADMNDRIAKLKQDYEEKAEPFRERVAASTEGLKMWAEANRTALTGGDKTKTVDLGTGEVKWRLRPPSVRITKVEDVLSRLRDLGLSRFIRVKEEPNKEAILADAETARTVTGIAIGTAGEDFIVEPFEAALASAPTT